MKIHTFARLGRPMLHAAAIMVGLSAATVPVFAQEAVPTQDSNPDRVIATVGDATITEADLSYAFEDARQVLANMQPQQRLEYLLKELINVKLMSAAARNENLQDSDSFKRRQTYLEERSLYRAYFTEKVAPSVTDETVQAAYDEYVAGFEPQKEVHARHILVKSEDDIKSIKAEIEGGKPFDVAAMEYSIDTGSAKQGGDLGFFGKGQMVPPFEAAAFTLKAGEMSEPVQSQFGWHLIKVEEDRMSAPTPKEQLEPQLRQKLVSDAFNAAMNKLSDGVDVDIKDEQLKGMYNSAPAADQSGQ